MRVLFAIVLTILGALPVNAETVVADLSQNKIAITANFDGSEILIFGAVERDAPAPIDAGPLDVVIAITGPSKPAVVRRKSKSWGIWVNKDVVTLDQAPIFYALASTAPIEQILGASENAEHRISIRQLIRSNGNVIGADEKADFAKALIRIRNKTGAYTKEVAPIKLTSNTLFQTNIVLPSNLVEGDYKARIFLVRDHKVIDQHEVSIDVQKVGLERWLYRLAYDKPFAYAILSLAIAIFAGWSASAIFRVFRLT
jgi:uncharacterized protein (TIGR02186 family)